MKFIVSSFYLFVVFLKLCSAQSLSSYFSLFKFHRLEATEIKTVYTEESYLACFTQCNQLVPDCKSFNVAVAPSKDGMYECVLLRERAPIEKLRQVLQISRRYHHYRRLTPCEAEYPCQNGGTCINNANQRDYSCQCLKGYTGSRCETIIDGLRLVGSVNRYEGRVEVYYNGQWGTVCDDFWDKNANAATVACKQLGFTSALEINTKVFGQGTGTIWLDSVQCNGQETKIQDCSHSAWGRHDCSHSEDVGIKCNL